VARILKNTAASITTSWYVDGTATDVGDVTVGIVDSAGTTVVAAGAATTNNGDGTYTYAIANSLTGSVAEWTVTWTDVDSGDDLDTEVEVVGSHLFTEAQARAFDLSALSDASTYSDADIALARDRITDAFESICEISFVPRYAREQLPGTGTPILYVSKPKVSEVLSATIGGTAQTVSDIVVLPGRGLHHTTTDWTAATRADPLNCVVAYEHGYTKPPGEITRAALIVLREQVVASDIPLRALGYSTEIGNVQLATAGMRGAWFGLPEVDAVLSRFSSHQPVF
jgi:hypothetical protein